MERDGARRVRRGWFKRKGLTRGEERRRRGRANRRGKHRTSPFRTSRLLGLVQRSLEGGFGSHEEVVCDGQAWPAYQIHEGVFRSCNSYPGGGGGGRGGGFEAGEGYFRLPSTALFYSFSQPGSP